MSQPNGKILDVDFQRKELAMNDIEKVRQIIMKELEEGWPSLTLGDWFAIHTSLVLANRRGLTGPLPESFKQELMTQIKMDCGSLTNSDLQDVHAQIAHAKRRERLGASVDIDDSLYGNEVIVSTR